MSQPETTEAPTEEPQPGMMGAGVGVFLRWLGDVQRHYPEAAALTEALHDSADPIVRDIYMAMVEAWEREWK